jgi:DNA-binding LacI/PurR family transcriptional regulator
MVGLTREKVNSLVDLAKLAGVSPGTVSRALSDTGMISKTTRERIKALALEHDFRPNPLARNLRTKRTGAIGVVLPLGHEANQHVSDPFFMTLLGHLADALTERGYDLLLSRVIPRDDRWLPQIIDSGRVDGVLVIGQSNQAHVIDSVAARYRPMVVWGAQLPGQVHCTVGSDNLMGGRIAARHLIDAGCKRISFLGDATAPEFGQRLEGVQATLAASGLPPAEALPVHLTAEIAHEVILAYLKGAKLPDGIIAASDIIAMSAIRALSECGMAVPEQVQVVGYDDIFVAEHTSPPLTTVRQNLKLGAELMVDMLFKRMAGEDTASVAMPPELIVRGSTRG